MKGASKTTFVLVFNAYYKVYLRLKLLQWLQPASLEPRVFYYIHGELQNSGESKTRLCAAEFRVKLLDPIC